MIADDETAKETAKEVHERLKKQNIKASYYRSMRNLDKELERKLPNEHKGSIKNYDWSRLYKCVDIGDNCY